MLDRLLFNEPENLQTRDPDLNVLPGGLVLSNFSLKKIHRPEMGLNPRTLASTLTSDH